jgi:uncharacterized repeat protein (TIGR01451 family)
MVKHKQKRKKQHIQQCAAVLSAKTHIMEEQAASTNKAVLNNANPSRWKRFKDWAKHASSFTDWCIAAFTLALAVTGIYQYVVINRQLDAMRKDQRAWLEFQTTPDKPGMDLANITITSGQPVTYPVRVVNIGKTPARNIIMKIYVDIVDASREPPLDRAENGGSSYPHGLLTAGIIFPNADFKQPVARPAKDGSLLLATESEVSAIKDARAYLAVYGVITYDDVFNAHHWTKFCSWQSAGGTFHTYQCTQYNNVDNN